MAESRQHRHAFLGRAVQRAVLLAAHRIGQRRHGMLADIPGFFARAPTISASLSSAAATHPAGNACRRRIWLMRCGLISANRLYWTWPCRVTGIPTAMVCSPRRAVLNRFVTTPCGDRACRIASGRTLLIGAGMGALLLATSMSWLSNST